jgi:phosphoribosylaminoimidazole-succinocarboxamide synthase
MSEQIVWLVYADHGREFVFTDKNNAETFVKDSLNGKGILLSTTFRFWKDELRSRGITNPLPTYSILKQSRGVELEYSSKQRAVI